MVRLSFHTNRDFSFQFPLCPVPFIWYPSTLRNTSSIRIFCKSVRVTNHTPGRHVYFWFIRWPSDRPETHDMRCTLFIGEVGIFPNRKLLKEETKHFTFRSFFLAKRQTVVVQRHLWYETCNLMIFWHSHCCNPLGQTSFEKTDTFPWFRPF